jgi:hypothetical protein
MHLAKCIVLTATIFFTVPRALDPAYIRGVKCVGHSQITVALVSALSNPQVHELLIRCSGCFQSVCVWHTIQSQPQDMTCVVSL